MTFDEMQTLHTLRGEVSEAYGKIAERDKLIAQLREALRLAVNSNAEQVAIIKGLRIEKENLRVALGMCIEWFGEYSLGSADCLVRATAIVGAALDAAGRMK